jgi:hypothetical protein
VISDPPLTRIERVKNVHFTISFHETLVVSAAKSCRTRAPPNSSGKRSQFYWSELLKPVLRIRIGFNADPDADPDPAFFVNADPDPDLDLGF